jgi:hypothetical protein
VPGGYILKDVYMIELHLVKLASNHSHDSNVTVAKWNPSSEGTVHINVDAAIFKTSNRMVSRRCDQKPHRHMLGLPAVSYSMKLQHQN